MSFFGADAVSDVLNTALDGLTMRSTVIADNIANVDTPGFRATSVDFEDSLRSAITDGEVDASEIDVTTALTDTPAGLNGNNVDLRKEVLASVQTTFQYQIMTRATSDRLAVLRTAAGGF